MKYINTPLTTKDLDGNIIEKKCKNCGKWKGVNEFWVREVKEKKVVSRECKLCSNFTESDLVNRGYIKVYKTVKGRKLLKNRIYDDDGNLLEKKCSKCKQYKEVYLFDKYTKSRDGYFSYCKDCVNDLGGGGRGLRNYERYKYDDDGNKTERLCFRCKKYYSLNEYELSKTAYCVNCSKEINKSNSKGIHDSKYVFDNEGKLVERKCSVCEEFKNVDEFGKNKILKYGVNSRCKVCVRNYHIEKGYTKDKSLIRKPVKRFYNKNGELIKKECGRCRKVLEKKYFGKGNDKDGLISRCKSCLKEVYELKKLNKN